MKAMIFAAGLGTRLRPLTDSIPKALVPVGGRPLIRHLIEKMRLAGYDDIVVNVHHFADRLEDYIRQNNCFGAKIAFSDERARLLDTGGGLLHARPLLEDGLSSSRPLTDGRLDPVPSPAAPAPGISSSTMSTSSQIWILRQFPTSKKISQSSWSVKEERPAICCLTTT